MNLNKRKKLMKAFITSQLSYYPLIWMFHSRNLINTINWIHEGALTSVYQNNLRFFELLDLGYFVKLQILVTKIYNVKNGIAPEIMKDIFEQQNPLHNLRSSV